MASERPLEGQSRIPTFASIQEEAEFWDTHSFTEFADELEEVTDVRFVPAGPKKRVTVSLDEKTYERLCGAAHRLGVRPSLLIHWWVLDNIWGHKPLP